jgi:hypothetical protein
MQKGSTDTAWLSVTVKTCELIHIHDTALQRWIRALVPDWVELICLAGPFLTTTFPTPPLSSRYHLWLPRCLRQTLPETWGWMVFAYSPRHLFGLDRQAILRHSHLDKLSAPKFPQSSRLSSSQSSLTTLLFSHTTPLPIITLQTHSCSSLPLFCGIFAKPWRR